MRLAVDCARSVTGAPALPPALPWRGTGRLLFLLARSAIGCPPERTKPPLAFHGYAVVDLMGQP
jgi:hypothetical protein